MNNKDLLKLLNNVVEENEIVSLNKNDRVLLIDGLNLFFRNFAMLNFINDEGVHVGGLGGFIRSLGTLINQINPTAIYIVFDGEGSTINRKNLLPEYKSNRNITRITNWAVFNSLEEEHEAKIDQIVRLVQYLKCLPVKTLSIDKVEADDIIAHLSQKLSENKENKIFIVSSDRDFIQLVNENIVVYRPIEKDYYTIESVVSKFGIPPYNFILYKTLLGDNSDKIQGIKGLGEKTILKKFPELTKEKLSLKDIFDISEKKLKDHITYSRVIFNKENLKKSYKIMDLGNPMIDEREKTYLNSVIDQPTPELDIKTFLKFYYEDGLKHLIKNIEYWVNENFRAINSYK